MRKTIADLKEGVRNLSEDAELADRKARRYHPFSFDFDSTPLSLEEPKEHWEEQVRTLHLENRARAIERLKLEYGTLRIEEVIKNVTDLGAKSMSLLAYHNRFHEQARRAFVAGLYYPALVAACALGERILNHLVLDLRDNFKSSDHYRKVYRKDSFDNWPLAVSALTEWKVLVDGVAADFLALGELRNRSIHFNLETYQSLREDALAALQKLNGLIAKQFGYFGGQPWFIEGTPGSQFVKQAYETDPFVRTYLLPQSALVGPLYGMEFTGDGWNHLDHADYGDLNLNDEEFARHYRERDIEKVVTREIIEKQRQAAAPLT